MAKSSLAKISLVASFFALIVIGLGAFTRLMDAGLGCPDWPGCYGHLLVTKVAPQFTSYKAWAEMIHRYFAATLSLLICAVIFLIFSKNRSRGNIIFACTLILLIIYQIVLGQLTVTWKLLPIIVTQHLLGGLFILSTLWLIYLTNFSGSRGQAVGQLFTTTNHIEQAGSRKIFLFSIIGTLLLFIQIFLGAWTSTNYAALSCDAFPYCTDANSHYGFAEGFNFFSPVGKNYDGGLLNLAAKQAIQISHRFGALIVSTYLVLFLMITFKMLEKYKLQKNALLILFLLTLQICLGISNIIFKLPIFVAILHNLTAALLLLSLITFNFKVFSKGKK